MHFDCLIVSLIDSTRDATRFYQFNDATEELRMQNEVSTVRAHGDDQVWAVNFFFFSKSEHLRGQRRSWHRPWLYFWTREQCHH